MGNEKNSSYKSERWRYLPPLKHVTYEAEYLVKKGRSRSALMEQECQGKSNIIAGENKAVSNVKLMRTLFLTSLFFLVTSLTMAQVTGTFKGKVIEESTKQPIPGASVYVNNLKVGATTDTGGIFVIRSIPVGTYPVTIASMGFQNKQISEVVITANKTYYTEIALLPLTSQLGEVTVMSFKGENNLLTPVSTYAYSREELFRSPGAQGDIMRALSSLPGVVSSGSQFSAIAARGQGTQDNVYMVDDIPMFNLSHLESEGYNSGFNDPNGGRFSIFAPRIIDNVQFQNGGFDALNGRRSSSYLALGVKEGNKESWSLSGQFDLMGATLIADGPVSQKTSIFASGRYQNFSALIRLLDEQRAAISYGDYLIKTTTEINAKNKLSFIAMYNPERPVRTIDDVESGKNINDDNSGGTTLYDHRGNKIMAGLNLRTLIDAKSYIKNVIYYRSSHVDNHFGRFNPSLDDDGVIINPASGGFDASLRTIKNDQQEIGYRSIYTKRFNKLTLTAGADAMVINLDYARTLDRTDTIYSFRSTDRQPGQQQNYQVLNPSLYNSSFDKATFNGSGYINLSWNISSVVTINPGMRYDYTGFTGQHTFSPRLSGSVAVDDRQSLNFASGIYYQDAAYADIAGQSAGNKLKNERSIQSILGYKMQFSSDLKLVVEGWHKDFRNVVVQPNRSQSYLNNNGSGYAYGADVNLTKRLSENYFGQISYSYMQSKRNNNDGLGEYDYVFNIPHTVSLMGSYKPNKQWIFSGKFRYSTGRPTDQYIVYTNVLNDPALLKYAQEVTSVNGTRLPDYISLDARVDYNKQTRWGVFSAFIDIVNVFNRFNVNTEVFLPDTGRVFNVGLGVFPTFGIRVEL
ncbi:Outer membrane receptor proteins, mostly Fe transport [Chitinophaga sp. YR627]|uniref:TonB-dependent receptor n=1 Tax=Chitinophaga sp. YR627 TaxID=1881041 RepID=UPI0008E9DD22|nr:TonB-dependent receptor [Chitinophaga sp. YR627]SFM63390.1 Outer membrane receptor proteins, mostly Fe transport [Chitinophaga sp. YR627]